MTQRKDIAVNNKKGIQAANKGNHELAQALLTEAFLWAKQIQAPLLMGVTKNNMGIAYQLAGRPAHARACFGIARQTVAEASGDDHPLLVVIDRNRKRLDEATMGQAA